MPSWRFTALIAGVLLLAACRPYEPHGTLVEPPLQTPDFTLTSVQGDVSKADLNGRFTLLFFGFTQCPDICPDTMARLRRVIDLLGPRQAEDVQVVLVTLDPERDDPVTVASYAAAFDPRFLGLSGSREAIDEVASNHAIYHQRVPINDERYTVDHTPAVTVLNRRGETVMIWRYGLSPDEMAADLRFLLRRS